MNARALTGFAVVLLATLMAATPVAFGQTIDIDSPGEDERFPLSYTGTGPILTGDVTVEYTASLPVGVTGEVHVYLDEQPMFTAAVGDPIPLNGLDAGAHVVMLWLADDSGVEYLFEPGGAALNPFEDPTPPAAAVRFFLSRVCYEDADCVDADPCTLNDCIGEVGVGGGWYGHCRFGDDFADTDCCLAESWCLAKGMLQRDGSGLVCNDTDGDTIGDCVECIVDADCPTHHSDCVESAICTDDGVCEYTINGCCSDNDCADGSSCTQDICCTGPGTPHDDCTLATQCVNPPIDPDPQGRICCDADTVEIQCDDGDYCTVDACIGGWCAWGRPTPNCCDADNDCNDAVQVNLCNDSQPPMGNGADYATCAGLDVGGGVMTGVCDYDFTTPGCCVQDYHCGDQYPEYLGTCVDNICQYDLNTEYCESPIETVVINEFQVNPASGVNYAIPDVFGEWIELFNPTDTDININGWTLEDLGDGAAGQLLTIDDAVDGVVKVPAGGYALIVRANTNGGLEALSVTKYLHPDSNFMLDNDEDEIIIRDQGGELQDEVAYDASWDVREGYSFALINPYLDNADPASWAHAKMAYPQGYVMDADGNFVNFGSPGVVNSDVFNTAIAPPGGTCDDGNPCTVDICNHDKASLCSHIALEGCCTTVDDIACNDHNVCTTDSCDVGTNTCVNDAIENCCVVDADCNSWYPDWVLPGEEADFEICATKACIGTTCRYGRQAVERPSCCLSGDHAYFGCEDRNLCTVDACTPDAGVDPYGTLYPMCVFNLDLDGDNINDCCRADDECEDSDPITLDYCNLDVTAGDMNTCQYPPDPDYCGTGGNTSCDDGDVCTDDYCCTGAGAPDATCAEADRCVHIAVPDCCTVDTDCIDGQACTEDVCCTDVGVPDAACLRPNSCAHPEVAAGCCTTHDDCRTPETNPYMPCRQGFCIGAVCRFGPFVDGCCVTEDDCSPGICDEAVCDEGLNQCVYTPVEGCCTSSADCDQDEAPGPCDANLCIDNACVVTTIPNCCDDDNPAGPDLSCDDGNPCTADYCTEVSGNFQCRYFPTGGVGCCVDDAMCPDDNVKCTQVSCCADESCGEDVNACQLDPISDCRATVAYKMSFTEGHAAYSGEYVALSDLAWTAVDIGTGAGLPYLGFRSTGDLGPDQYLSFYPTATVADFETCAVLPMVRTELMERVTVGFDFAADWQAGTAGLVLRGATDGDWANALPLPGFEGSVTQDMPARHYNVSLPLDIINSDDTQIAFCFTASTSDNLVELMVDEVVVSEGRNPVWQDVVDAESNNLTTTFSIEAGDNATHVSAFRVRDIDTDEAVSIRLVGSPGSWLSVTNVRRDPDDDTTVLGDFVITGAVCRTRATPTTSPSRPTTAPCTSSPTPPSRSPAAPDWAEAAGRLLLRGPLAVRRPLPSLR